MAARRPPGKVHHTAAGADEVAPPAPPPPPPAAARRAARADTVHRDDPGKGDLLDQRERSQKPSRKASGPAGKRLRNDDVLIDDRRISETAPTDPE